jgi:hypothetical protein
LQAETLRKNDISIEFNDIQLNISSEYKLIPAFEEHPKYIKYVDQLPVSSFYVKNKRLCLDYCKDSFEGLVFADGDSSQRLSIVHGNDYSASLWKMEFTSSEGTVISTIGIIYNSSTMLQVVDDKSLWLSLLSQLKSKS